ncbi:MAG TPA: polyprenyl synthetase family protein [Bacteroidales bacterium]|nr:polyprenyl synthetase family protein [Bacteroidales bacterium]
MSTLNDIKKPIQQHLTEFEARFKISMHSSVPLLNKVTQYILKRKGKQMRPMFVMLAADICGKISDSTYHAASLIELLHTATLVHDDVVDDSNERRGFFSINALWKNKIAVLVGDYLLSRGLLLSIENNEFELLKIVSEATREMSEGELLQIEKARRLDISEDIYFEIIRKKTASLIASCCACGASSVKASPEVVDKMHRFGEYVGIAFQIKDDLFDYEKSNATGKPNGIDIKEQKMTLPLIFLLENSSFFDKKRLIHTIKHHHQNPEKVAEVIKQVNQSGGIEYAYQRMMEYQNKALDILNEFPDSPSKQAMQQLVIFTTERRS